MYLSELKAFSWAKTGFRISPVGVPDREPRGEPEEAGFYEAGLVRSRGTIRPATTSVLKTAGRPSKVLNGQVIVGSAWLHGALLVHQVLAGALLGSGAARLEA